MRLAIHSLEGKGDHTHERLVLRATDACELMHYIVADSTYVDQNTVSNQLRHMHWFLRASLRKGDWVVLYTRSGIGTIKEQADGSKVYYRYWGLSRPVWNDSGDDAVLFEIGDLSHKRAK